MRGRSIPLSVPRRLVVGTDTAMTIPSVPIERVMDLSAVIVARNACSPRPPWAGILAKACAITGQQLRKQDAPTSIGHGRISMNIRQA